MQIYWHIFRFFVRISCILNEKSVSLHIETVKNLRSDMMLNAGKLLSANVVAQVVALLVYPLLTRIYAPEDFGLLTFFLNIGNLIVLVATMEYQYAVLLAKEHRQSVAAVQLSTLLSIGWIVVLCLLLPFRGAFAEVFHIEENTDCLWLLPLYVAGGAGWNILNMYLTRRKAFGRLSGYKLTNGLLAPAGKLAFGYFGMTSFGLIIASVIASLAALVLTIGKRLGRWWKRLWQVDRVALSEVATSYKKFPLFSLPRALVNTLGIAIPALVLTPVFGLKDLGFFSMAITLAFMPITLVVNSVQQVLFQKVTEKVHKRESILPAMRRLTLKIVIAVVPSFILLYFPLPWLTGWLLGDEWLVTGEYIRCMLPWLLMVCLNGTICFVADVFMAQGAGLAFECAILLARLAGLMAGIWIQRFDVAIMGYIAGTTVVLVAQQIWFYTLIRRYERTLL